MHISLGVYRHRNKASPRRPARMLECTEQAAAYRLKKKKKKGKSLCAATCCLQLETTPLGLSEPAALLSVVDKSDVGYC